jgi:LuxR family maltose regulon positive regulatory protein
VSELLLATKIHIPPVHGNLVSRPRLIQRLNDGLTQNHRLMLISAPAGYGKSTLLSDWVSQVDLPAAWLSLEIGENTPARFWGYFLSALASIPQLHQAGIGEAMRQALQSPKPPEVEALLDSLLNELSQLTSAALLVLDDLHTITDSQIHHDLVYLIDHLPKTAHGLHLVVASRMDPPWPLARWRARGELSELRSSDLRFSSDEVVQFLNRTLQLTLSAQDIRALEERTEGWIAGLQMAAVTMQGRLSTQGAQGVSRFIETFAGTNRFIMDYLMEEVINQQPAGRRDFLQATSILEQFTAPLCDALLERQDSQAMLEQVEQVNLFLIPLDDERQWYRYHHLFADLLYKRLKQTQPALVRELHQRASEWYAQNNFLTEAISHALDSGDVVQVNRLVSGNALAMVEHAGCTGRAQAFRADAGQEICSKPWLCVAYAWVKAYVDPSGEMDRIFLNAMQSVNGVEDALERRHLTSHLDAMWAYVAWVKGQADVALEFIHTALGDLPKEDWLTRAHLLNIEGLALQNLDYLPEAVQSFEAAVAAGQRTGRLFESLQASTIGLMPPFYRVICTRLTPSASRC